MALLSSTHARETASTRVQRHQSATDAHAHPQRRRPGTQRQGLRGTRLTDIADQAELRAPAIYYYFKSREDLIEEVMFCGISDLRTYLQDALDALPPDTAPMDRIMTAVESHLRHELELSDYARASIRNSGQIPPGHLKTRQKKEEAAYDRIWRGLMKDAAAEGRSVPT